MYRSYANHTSNTGITSNPAEAEVTTQTVDIVAVHLITNKIEYFNNHLWPLSDILLTHLCLSSHKSNSGKQYRPRSKRGVYSRSTLYKVLKSL